MRTCVSYESSFIFHLSSFIFHLSSFIFHLSSFIFLFCFVLFCFVLFCFVLFCFVLFCFVLFCFVLFCFVLFCFVLFCFVLFCFVLFCFVLFCFVLFCFVLFCLTIKDIGVNFSPQNHGPIKVAPSEVIPFYGTSLFFLFLSFCSFTFYFLVPLFSTIILFFFNINIPEAYKQLSDEIYNSNIIYSKRLKVCFFFLLLLFLFDNFYLITNQFSLSLFLFLFFLKDGELVMFDNRRVLHGRRAFNPAGNSPLLSPSPPLPLSPSPPLIIFHLPLFTLVAEPRHLRGTYLGMDEVEDRYHTLLAQLNK